ncbi:hypothetical protein [Megalodesulfovibrio paquesii]
MEHSITLPAVPPADTAATLALRSALQPDMQLRARGVLLLDRAGRQVEATAVVRDWVFEDDVDSLAWPGTGLLASRLRVGAARRLWLNARFLTPDGTATVTPLVLTPDGSQVVGLLASQVATAAFRESTLGGAWRSRRLDWATCGAACLALHVSGLTAGAGESPGVQLLGGVARPTGAVALSGPLLAKWAPVPETAPNQNQTTPDWAGAASAASTTTATASAAAAASAASATLKFTVPEVQA